jgi:nicotinamidase-related amidase
MELCWNSLMERLLTMSTALLVVDMQNAFFTTDPLRKRLPELAAHCNELIAGARKSDIPVVNVRTQHERNKSTWARNMLEDDKGFVFQGDYDAQNLEGLDIGSAVQLVKTRDDAFFGTDLEARLRNLGVDRLVLAGVSTHSCIALTAAGAYARDLEVILAKDAIASHLPQMHQPSLDVLKAEYRQSALSNGEILRDTGRFSATC